MSPSSPTSPDPLHGPFRESIYGLTPVEQAREELGGYTGWRYGRGVEKFLQQADADEAFYQGLGGLVVRELGFVSEVERDEAINNANHKKQAAEAELLRVERDMNPGTLMASASANFRHALEKTKDPKAVAAALRAKREAKTLAPTKAQVAKRAAMAKMKDADFEKAQAEKQVIHPLADKEEYKYISPRNRRQRRDQRRVLHELAKMKDAKPYVDHVASSAEFLRQKTHKVEVTGDWIKGHLKVLKYKLDHNEIHPDEYKKEKRELKHALKHTRGERFNRRLATVEIPADWWVDDQITRLEIELADSRIKPKEFARKLDAIDKLAEKLLGPEGKGKVRKQVEQPVISPPERYYRKKDVVENGMLAIDDIINSKGQRSTGNIKKRADKLKRKHIRLRDSHRVWQTAVGTDKRLRDAKRGNRDHLDARFPSRDYRTMYDLENDRLVTRLPRPRQKHMADVTGWISVPNRPVRKEKRSRIGYNRSKDRTIYSRKKFGKHKDIADVTGWM